MKRFYLLSALMFLSCGDNGVVPYENEGLDTSGYVLDDQSYEDLNLSKNGINIIMQVPEQSGSEIGSQSMIVENIQENTLHIKYGIGFEFFITDYGIEEDLIKYKKKELTEEDFFKITYSIESDSLIVYNRKVNYRDEKLNAESVTKSSNHIYQLKNIDGYNYIFKSPDEGCSKEDIELLKVVFNSVTKPYVN